MTEYFFCARPVLKAQNPTKNASARDYQGILTTIISWYDSLVLFHLEILHFLKASIPINITTKELTLPDKYIKFHKLFNYLMPFLRKLVCLCNVISKDSPIEGADYLWLLPFGLFFKS